MKKLFLWHIAAALMMLTACSPNDECQPDLSFIGKPMNIAISFAEMTDASTRVSSPMTTGTAWLDGTGNLMKAYTYSGDVFTTENPLLWTATPMRVCGYYADGGTTMVDNTHAYTAADPSAASFLAGATTATYTQDEQEEISLSLRQQLAYIYVTVSSDYGTVMTEAKLGNGMLYTTGIFDNSSFDLNGFANAGTDNSGWTTSGSPTTINMTQSDYSVSSSTTSYTYEGIIIPQTIGTSKPFFTVKINGYPVGFRLNASQTFKAGARYNLSVDRVTKMLYIQSVVNVSDFTDSGSSTSQSDLAAN